MPSKANLLFAGWILACAFMLLHVGGYLLLGWDATNPAWWLGLTALLSMLAIDLATEDDAGR
jgi:4-hydroxybenzoate polyprenyltransferase